MSLDQWSDSVQGALVHIDGFSTKEPIRSTALEPLYDHWLALRGARKMPSRKDLDLLTIPKKSLPHLVIWDVLRRNGGLDFMVRLAGTEVERFHGRSIKGLSIEDLFPPDESIRIRASTAEVVMRREGRCGRFVRYAGSREIFVSAGVSLPLSSDGEQVDAVLVCVTTSLDLRWLEDVKDAMPLFTPPGN